MSKTSGQESAWKPLRQGSKVAVVNACMNDRNAADHAQKYRELFASFGYGVNGLDELVSQKADRLWAGSVEERAFHLIDALMNEENEAIFLLVGGDGANEVMHLVARAHLAEKAAGRPGLPCRGVPVFGLSNNTTLLNPLAQMGIISQVQGKLDASIPERVYSEAELQMGDEKARENKQKHNAIWSDLNSSQRKVVAGNAQALQQLLSGAAPELSFAVTPLNDEAREYKGEAASVEIVGGCNFHVIESARTPFQVETKGKFLALEGPEEQCSVAETIAGLRREGMLDGVKALFLGYVAGGDTEKKQAEIAAATKDLGIPVFAGLPWGHIGVGAQADRYLPLNTAATFNAEDGGVATLKVSAFRAKENLDKAYAAPVQEVVANLGKEIAGDLVVTSMQEMLQEKDHPNLSGKEVVLATFPKFGEPVTAMMDVSQGLAAMLHKGSLQGIKSLTLDLAGLYEVGAQGPLYRSAAGQPLQPPHKYNDGTMFEKVADEKTYAEELKNFVQKFCDTHLGEGVKVEVGRDKVVEKVAEETGLKVDDLKAAYKEADSRARVDASAMAQDYNNGEMRGKVAEMVAKKERPAVGSHSAAVLAHKKSGRNDDCAMQP